MWCINDNLSDFSSSDESDDSDEDMRFQIEDILDRKYEVNFF